MGTRKESGRWRGSITHPSRSSASCGRPKFELGRGATVPLLCKKLGITEGTYYRWRQEYGGMRLDQARRLKHLEQENTRLKKLVADLSLDNAILKEAAQGNS